MIRQAISCDVCGTEKKQTNHWFVVHEQGGEFRLSGWNSRIRTRTGSKHLCGQTCLHKLVDEFMARTISARAPAAGELSTAEAQAATADTSLTSVTAFVESEREPRIVAPLEPILAKRAPVSAAPVVPFPESLIEPAAVALEEPAATHSSRNWRAEAWERERERELRSVDRRPDIAARRRASKA